MPLTFNPFGPTRVVPSSIADEQIESLLSPEERNSNTEVGASDTDTSDSSAQKSSTLSRFTSSFKKTAEAALAFTKTKKPEDASNPSQEIEDVLTNPSQETRYALFSACRNGDLETCKKLIDNKADVNTYLFARETPLMHASEAGHGHIVKFLIEAGVNINAVDIDGETALFKSCGKPNHEVTNILIDAGANVNSENSRGETPLFRASLIDNVEIVQKLIDKGAHLDLTTKYGQSPLHIASQKGNKDTVAILVKEGS